MRWSAGTQNPMTSTSLNVVRTTSLSRSPSRVRGRCSPGVSTMTSWASARLTIPRIARRVVCGLSLVIATLVPTRAFVRVDLPVLGRPTKQPNPERNARCVAGSVVISKVSHCSSTAFSTHSRIGLAARAPGKWSVENSFGAGRYRRGMPTTTTLLAFTAAAVALILLPGPNVIFLLARGIGDGRRVALISVAGVETATAVFVLVTAAGLSAVIASSAVAFSLLRYGGAAYLIYLGVRALLGRGHLELVGPTAPRPPSGGRAFAEAFGVGIANPKVAIFFVAFFPQFLDPHRGSTTSQILVLGAIFTLLGLLFDTVWATSAGSVGTWLRRRCPRSWPR